MPFVCDTTFGRAKFEDLWVRSADGSAEVWMRLQLAKSSPERDVLLDREPMLAWDEHDPALIKHSLELADVRRRDVAYVKVFNTGAYGRSERDDAHDRLAVALCDAARYPKQ